MKLVLHVDVEIVENIDTNVVARIHYPNEGTKIVITKGLNMIELSTAIHHEIGHLVDWYISEDNSNTSKNTRENNANIIGEGIRWKCNKE